MDGIQDGLIRIALLLPFLLGFLAFLRWLAMDPPPREPRRRRGTYPDL